ncbi:unnamed protein product [Arabidopsis halleri]
MWSRVLRSSCFNRKYRENKTDSQRWERWTLTIRSFMMPSLGTKQSLS